MISIVVDDCDQVPEDLRNTVPYVICMKGGDGQEVPACYYCLEYAGRSERELIRSFQ
jgi:hypothetical protein